MAQVAAVPSLFSCEVQSTSTGSVSWTRVQYKGRTCANFHGCNHAQSAANFIAYCEREGVNTAAAWKAQPWKVQKAFIWSTGEIAPLFH